MALGGRVEADGQARAAAGILQRSEGATHTHTCRESECNQVMATVSPGGLCEQTLQDMLFLHREVLDVLQQHHACCS